MVNRQLITHGNDRVRLWSTKEDFVQTTCFISKSNTTIKMDGVYLTVVFLRVVASYLWIVTGHNSYRTVIVSISTSTPKWCMFRENMTEELNKKCYWDSIEKDNRKQNFYPFDSGSPKNFYRLTCPKLEYIGVRFCVWEIVLQFFMILLYCL